MNVDVSTDIVIDRPPEIVARYASDRTTSRVVREHQVGRMQTQRPLTVGSRIAFVAYFLGRRMAYTYKITELSSTRLVMRTSEGPFPMETSYTWEHVEDGRTRMTLRNRGVPTGFSRWVSPFMAMAMRRANKKDLVLLKTRLEER